MGVSGAAMFCDIHAGRAENLPSWCAILTPRIAPLDTAPFPATPGLPGNGPSTGMSSQRAPSAATGAGEAAAAVPAAAGTGARSSHMAGDCAANVAALPVAELERNVARLVGEMVAIVEQSLKAQDDGTSELPTSPLLASDSEPEPESAIEDLLDDDAIAGLRQES